MPTQQTTIAWQTDKPLSAYGPLAAQAEAYGFDGVTVYNDMLYQPAWYPLMEMARATERVRLGPAAVNPFTSHPINIAGNASLLAQAAPGRTYLGLARGAWLDFVGVRPKSAITKLHDAFITIRHLLRQDKSPLPGKHFPIAGGDTLRWDIEDSEIPFLLGTWGKKTIAACQQFATEIKLGGTANPGVVPWLRGQIDDSVGIVIGAVTVVDEDGTAARTIARREVALYLPVVAKLDPTVVVEPDRLAGIEAAAAEFDFETAATFVSDELLAKFAFAGTPKQVASQALELFEAGATRVEFGTPHGISAETGLRLLGEKVLPTL